MNLLPTKPTSKPEHAPDIEIVPRIASVTTQANRAPAAETFVFTIDRDAYPK